MNLPLIDILRGWHDFHTLIGAASATLVGLMFVAASIGAGVFTRAHQAGIRSFLSPTVAHFSAVLTISLFATVPVETWGSLGALLICTGLLGLVYAVWIWRRMVRRGIIGTIDLADRLWYALLPIAGYLLVAIAGALMSRRDASGLTILAAALILLLLIGIRNAWDMTVWIIDRRQS
ncbi:MAG: hypothetical protein ACREQE_11090 [Candidatus Binataceae bacterium]